MNRRGFLTSVASATVGIYLPVPKWLGESAGGLYVPVPDDLSTILDWHPTTLLMTQDVSVTRVTTAAVWAPPGATHATVQMWGASLLGHRLSAGQRENAERSVREVLGTSHDPGWLKVHETYETDTPQGYDEDGKPYFYASRNVWRRIGYLQWLKPSTLRGSQILVAA